MKKLCTRIYYFILNKHVVLYLNCLNTGYLYCKIRCDGRVLYTRLCKDILNPEWNDRTTFYRKSPEKDIIIEVHFLFYHFK